MSEVRTFRKKVFLYYRKHARVFPWRETRDPYRILVSEIMLQQTQADRVVKKYGEFLKEFPTVRSLARSPLARIIRAWQGLGYNRRALYLKRAAEIIVEKYGGRIPRNEMKLRELPGIGPYTAAAVSAFAYNIPTVFIETNIRSAFIHHFFPARKKVKDSEILPLINNALSHRNPRHWYQALMDYGAYVKRVHGNPGRRSAHYVRQASFRGSDREIRGTIIRLLAEQKMRETELAEHLKIDSVRARGNLLRLTEEGMIKKKLGIYEII